MCIVGTYHVRMSGVCKNRSGSDGKRDEEYTQDNTLTEDIPESDLGETGNNGEKDYGEFPEPVLFPEEFAFEYEVWKNETTQIKTPGGIVYDGESMVVCDTGNHCVARLTTDGEFVESYGELGSETGNFVKPTSLVLYKDEIYVLDAGNMRVQVFDKEMQFLREILFEAAPLLLWRLTVMAQSILLLILLIGKRQDCFISKRVRCAGFQANFPDIWRKRAGSCMR